MNTIFEAHPEILTIERDQKTLSPVIRGYIDQVYQTYPTLSRNTEVFAEVFSHIPQFSPAAVRELSHLDQWAYTPNQQEFSLQQLLLIANNYPVPSIFAHQVLEGLSLNLSQELDAGRFYQSLDFFAAQVESLPAPEPLDFDVKEIGKLPLQEIHDPLLQGKLHTLWTLDVAHNPGLSIKDVMALWMIQEARKQEKIQDETILVEGTSGNTGAGMAIVAKKLGLKTILAIPDKMSQEKINRLRLLGAHVVVTPTKVDANDPRSYYAVRDYLAKMTHAWQASQYDNQANSLAHEVVTGPQIWEHTRGKVTAIIATAGTGGTISGIGRFLKKQNPEIKIIAVDTIGSILYLLKAGYSIQEVQQYAKGYTIQGFGEDIHPQNLDLSVIDHFLRVSDADGLHMTRMLPMLGFVAGQSSGAAYAAVHEAIAKKLLSPEDKAVVIFPDTGVPYRKDVYSKTWMDQQQYII